MTEADDLSVLPSLYNPGGRTSMGVAVGTCSMSFLWRLCLPSIFCCTIQISVLYVLYKERCILIQKS